MRIKEWFGWHFPELAREVTDNETYIRCVHAIQNRDLMDEDTLATLEEIVHDGEIAQRIIDASNISMGQDLSEIDTQQLNELASNVIN